MVRQASEWVWVFSPFVDTITAEIRGYLGLFLKYLNFPHFFLQKESASSVLAHGHR